MKEDYIFTERLKLKEILEKIKRSRMGGWTYPCLGFGLSSLITCLSSPEYKNIGKEGDFFISGHSISISMICLTVIFLLTPLIVYIFLWCKEKKRPKWAFDIDNMINIIMRDADMSCQYNAIFLFPDIQSLGKGDLRFLVAKNPEWNSWFFSYFKIGEKEKDMDMNKILERAYSHFRIPTSLLLSISELGNTIYSFKMKPNSDIPHLYAYRVFLAYPTSPFFKNLIMKFVKHPTDNNEYEFLPINKMLDDKETWKYNDDLISKVNQLTHEIKTNVLSFYEKNKSKIIWNIHKSCSKGCSFCAYGVEGRNKTNQGKGEKTTRKTIGSTSVNAKSVDNILKKLSCLWIDEIDFAMGCNTATKDIQSIIQNTKSKLPATKIHITANANLLNSMDFDFLKNNIDVFELTYDYHEEDDGSAFRTAHETFNQENLAFAKRCGEAGKNVKIHTVWTQTMSCEKITSIYTELSETVDGILLIRLMPLGNLNKDIYPQSLLNSSTYISSMKSIKEGLGDDAIKFHCSLQGLDGEKNNCELCRNKLGISPEGNLFACPWGEHLDCDLRDNPFFLVNLANAAKKETPELIIESKHYEDFSSQKFNKQHCRIFSYVYSPLKVMKDCDPIYKK